MEHPATGRVLPSEEDKDGIGRWSLVVELVLPPAATSAPTAVRVWPCDRFGDSAEGVSGVPTEKEELLLTCGRVGEHGTE